MDLGEVVTGAVGGGMATGNPYGAIAGGLLAYQGTQDTNRENEHIAEVNNAWSADQYSKRYQTMTADLKAAGLNPMLAYSQSPGSAPTAQQVQFQNPLSAAVQGYSDVLGTRAKATADISSANKAYAEAEKIDQDTIRIKELIKQGEPAAVVQGLVAAANRDKAAGLNYEAQTRHLSQLVKNLKTSNLITQAQYDVMEKTGFIGQVARELKPISDIGSDWFGLKAIFDKNKILSRPREPREKRSNTTHYDSEGNVSGSSSTNSYER